MAPIVAAERIVPGGAWLPCWASAVGRVLLDLCPNGGLCDWLYMAGWDAKYPAVNLEFEVTVWRDGRELLVEAADPGGFPGSPGFGCGAADLG